RALSIETWGLDWWRIFAFATGEPPEVRWVATAKWPYLRSTTSGITLALYWRMEPTHRPDVGRRCPMRQRLIDDPWARQLLDRAEDHLAGARAFTTRRGVVGPRRRAP